MMQEVWGDWVHVLRPALLGLLAAGVAIRLLVRWRSLRDVPRAQAWRYSVAEVGMVAGTAPWVWMVLTAERGDRAVSLVPFWDLAAQLDGATAGAVAQVAGNLLALAALGFFLPLRVRLARGSGRRDVAVLIRVAVIATVLSVLVEALQYSLYLGRVNSVDVLVSTAGAVLAAVCSRRWWRS